MRVIYDNVHGGSGVTDAFADMLCVMGGGYVTVEFRTETPEGEQIICEGPWFNEQLRGDFAWYWCGTAEDALSRMMGFPNAENLPNPP